MRLLFKVQLTAADSPPTTTLGNSPEETTGRSLNSHRNYHQKCPQTLNVCLLGILFPRLFKSPLQCFRPPEGGVVDSTQVLTELFKSDVHPSSGFQSLSQG